MKKMNIWMIMLALVFTTVLTPTLTSSKVHAEGETKYEAENADGIDAEVETGGDYSGSGFRVLGDQANGSRITWNNVHADAPGNYIFTIKYSNTSESDKPVSLLVNGQRYTTFAGSNTGEGPAPTWGTATAVVMLNAGNNVVALASEGADGPAVDVLEATPYATIFESETGAGAAHSGATIGANAGTAPGFSGTGYASVAAGVSGYLQYNNVVVPQAGKYTIKVRYSNGSSARPYAVSVNGVRVPDAKGLATGAWANWRYEELTGIDFEAGVNTLKIERIGANATPVIDKFEVVSESTIEVGHQTFRTTTFESADIDPAIAAAATGEALNSPLIAGSAYKSTAASTVKLVEEAGSRWAEVTSPAAKQGIIGFPFHSSWMSPVPMSSYTFESTFMLKDEKANYIFKLASSAGLESPLFVFGMDKKIYARSNSTAAGALAARADWSDNTAYKVELELHLDTKSYSMYLNDVQIVHNEPLQNDPYIGGLKGYFMEVKDGARQETKILVDNVELSGSSAAGTEPVINPNPGAIYDEQPYIGTPVQYYVSPTGLDTNNGMSAGTPFKTINKAVSATNPGDTVNIMPGVYSPANDANDYVLINRSGARDVSTGQLHYITYKAYDPNNKPKLLLPPNVKGVWDMVDISANYIILEGIEIEGTNLTLTLAEAEANYEHKVAGGSDWSRYALTNTNGISAAGHHIIVRNSYVHHMSGAGFNSKGDYLWFHNNVSHSNSWYTMYATSGMSNIDNTPYDNNSTDYKIIMSNNLIYDNETKVKWDRTQNYSDGNGIIFDTDDIHGYNESGGKKLVINNVVYNNGGGGIHSYRSNNVHVFNNTIYHNSRSPHLKYPNMDAQSSDNNVFLNNISIARDEEGEYANLNSGWNNLFANNIYGGQVRFLGDNERVIDPKFISVEEDSYDFRLQADSPAIDQGAREYPLLSGLAQSITEYGTLLFGTGEDLTGDMAGNARPYAGEGTHNRVDIGAYEMPYNSDTPLVDDAVHFTPAPPDVTLETSAARGTAEIDGLIDPIWSTTESFQASKISDPTKGAPSAKLRMLWDEQHLYVLAEVQDANLSAIGGNLWEHDSMEFFVDENNEKTAAYQADDSHYRVNYLNLRSAGKNATANGFESAAQVVDGGYVIEVALPLRTITGTAGKVIGFDAGASDDSNGDGIRDNATMWNNQRFNSHASTKFLGNVTLTGPQDITGIQPVEVTTTAGTAPVMPTVVTVVYSNATTASANVVWDAIPSSSYASAGSFTVNGTVQGTAIKAVASITVTASSSGTGIIGPVGGAGNGVIAQAGSRVELMPTLNGTTAKAEMTEELLKKLLDASEATNGGSSANRAIIELKALPGADAYVQSLPAEGFNNGKGLTEIEIRTAFGTIILPDTMLKKDDLDGAGKVEIRIAKGDISALSEKLQEQIGDKPVLKLSVLVDGKLIPWNNKQAPVTVSVDYDPTPEELVKPEHIGIWYIDDAGTIVKLPSGKYDAATGKVTFSTTHFSQYAVGYEIKTFADLGGYAWAKEQIEALVSKGIVNGTSDTTYGPSQSITRADFIALLVRALSIEADVSANFNDVSTSDYYYEEVGIAKALGITNGVDGKRFAPKEPITRQDMMVLAARAMKIAGKKLPSATADLSSFSDDGQVADYAADSVASLVEAGIVQGDGSKLNPNASASRAEVAVIIYRIYNQADNK